MSTHKKIDIVCIAAAFLFIALTVLFMNGKSFDVTAFVSEAADSEMFTADDLNSDWDTSLATKIELSDRGSVISGKGAYAYDGNIYILYAGCYVLSGELTDGNVIIDAKKNDVIRILLDGMTIHCDDDAAIRVEQAGKVFLTLNDDTESAISSGAKYKESIADTGVDGTLYSRDDLTINGAGTLTVNAEYRHGIVCNDDLAITGGSITINAVRDGIHANDSVRVRNAALSISAGDDGITVSNDDETAFFYVASGEITIPSCYEGIEAVDITIAGGTIDIMPTDDGINAAGRGENSVIRITGGDTRIVNSSGRDADGLDSNGSIYMEGGRVFISVSNSGGNCALDYGRENGGECVISGGIVVACGGSAMAEGFDQDSPQGYLMYHSTSTAAGTKIRLEDAGGKELLSEEIPYGFSAVVLSTPEMEIEDTCTITIGEVQEEIMIDNIPVSDFVPAGMFGGGMRNGTKPFGGRDEKFSDKNDPPDGKKGFPYKMGRPNEEEGFSDNMSSHVDGGQQNKQEMQEENGKMFEPGTERIHNNGIYQREQAAGQMNHNENISSSDISSDVWILIGISAVILLVGLFLAMKIKH